MVECALIVPLTVMLLFGVSSIGIRLGRTIQAIQLARDIGHMYALGVDFSKVGNQNIATTLGGGFNLTSTGDTLLILSRVVKVYQATVPLPLSRIVQISTSRYSRSGSISATASYHRRAFTKRRRPLISIRRGTSGHPITASIRN